VIEGFQRLAWWDWPHEVYAERLNDFRQLTGEKFLEKYQPESVTSLANIPVKPTSAPTRGDNWVRF
jgi:hypothetical protein